MRPIELRGAIVANRALLLTLLVAFVLRLGLAVAVQHQVAGPPARLCLISGDAEGYWELAHKIVTGGDYSIYQPPRFVLRMPGFPLLLAFSQAIFGENPLAARCLLAGVGTAACGLTYWLGRELMDPMTGLLAAIYTACSPTLCLFSVLILSETTFAMTLVASLIAMARLARRQNAQTSPFSRSATSLVVGILIGVATLVRPTWLYAGSALALGAGLLARSQNGSPTWRHRAMSVAWMGIGLVVTMAPWTIRNYAVTGHVVPTTLWVGPSLYDGLNPEATGDSNMQFFEDDRLLTRMSEFDMDREYRRRAWAFAAENPGRAVWLSVEKQKRYWSLTPNAAQFNNWPVRLAVCLTVLPLFCFAARGIWISRGNSLLLMLTVGPIVLFAGFHLLFVGSLRYRLPAEFPLAVVAAVGCKPIFNRQRPHPEPQ
jgi:4-amino-4-deoxy-L-arabinose transferase-like glycosyltransferase